MQEDEISSQLLSIASSNQFELSSANLVQRWTAEGVGVESFRPVLRFMEDHPAIGFGSPGPLVHFIEKVASVGKEEDATYARELSESIQRRPVPHTAWLLHRLINSIEGPEKEVYTNMLRNAPHNPKADPRTIQAIAELLE